MVMPHMLCDSCGVERAYQGHPYTYRSDKFIALETGHGILKFLQYDPEAPWIGFIKQLHTDWIKRQPLVYLKGQSY